MMNDLQKMELMKIARNELVQLRGVCSDKNNGLLGRMTYKIKNKYYLKDIDTISIENVISDLDYGIKLIDKIKLLLEGIK